MPRKNKVLYYFMEKNAYLSVNINLKLNSYAANVTSNNIRRKFVWRI